MAMRVTATINCRLTLAGTTNHYKSITSSIQFSILFRYPNSLTVTNLVPHSLVTVSKDFKNCGPNALRALIMDSKSQKNTHPNLTDCEKGPVAALP